MLVKFYSYLNKATQFQLYYINLLNLMAIMRIIWKNPF